MSARHLGLVVLAAALLATGCSEPDRSAGAEELGRQIRGLPSIADVNVSYAQDSVETSESLRILAITEPSAAPADACAAVRAFIERLPGTEIDPGQSQLEVRDEGGALRWSFTVRGGVREAAQTERLCVDSQQARVVGGAYAVRAAAAAGLELARAAVAAFEDFAWSVYVICGEALCDRADS
jgi:hypothetical protein